MRRYCSLENIPKEAGFTLVEVVVALAIMGVVIAASTTSFITHLRANYTAELIFEGEQAAQSVIDDLRYEEVSSLPLNGTDSPRNITMNALREFQVYVTYCPEDTYCSSDTVRHLRVRADYRGERVYQTETVFTQLERGGVTSDESEGSLDESNLPTPTPAPTPSASTPPSDSSSNQNEGRGRKKKRCKYWGC